MIFAQPQELRTLDLRFRSTGESLFCSLLWVALPHRPPRFIRVPSRVYHLGPNSSLQKWPDQPWMDQHPCLCLGHQRALALRVLSSHRCALSFQITETPEAVFPQFDTSPFGGFGYSPFQIVNSLNFVPFCIILTLSSSLLTLAPCFVSFVNSACKQSLQKNHVEQDSALRNMPPDACRMD